MDASTGREFVTVFGRGLVGELPKFVPRPYLVVSMADLWPQFEPELADGLGGVHLVRTLDLDELRREAAALPACRSVIGLGGGQAIDVAKFFAWTLGLPIFQVPTAMTVNAPFGHRSGIRTGGVVRYMGWAVPEAVYVDFDVIASAPPLLNRSGSATSCATTPPMATGGSPETSDARSPTGRTTSRWSLPPASGSTAFSTISTTSGRSTSRDPDPDDRPPLGWRDLP